MEREILLSVSGAFLKNVEAITMARPVIASDVTLFSALGSVRDHYKGEGQRSGLAKEIHV